MTAKLADFFIIGALVILPIFLYNFFFMIPQDAVIGDAERYNGYQMYIIKYSLSHFGQFALWDQFISSGMSWISHPGGALFSPTAWIIILLVKDIILGSRLLFVIHAVTAAFAMYFLLRVLSVRKITAVVVSIIYLCTDYALLFALNGWFEEFFGLTLMPLTAALLWMGYSRKNYAYIVLAAFAMSLHFFMNTYYVFHYNAIVLLWISFAFFIKSIASDKKAFISLSIVFWSTFIGLSAIKLIPLIEFRGISSRSTFPLSIIETPDQVMTLSFLTNLLTNFFIPAGHTDFLTGLTNKVAVMMSILPFLYLLFKRKFEYVVFAGLLIIAVWGYFAHRAPIDLYKFFYYFLPGFNSNQYPYRFYIIIHFAFIVCIALGLNSLLGSRERILKILGYTSLLILLIEPILFVKQNKVISAYSIIDRNLGNTQNIEKIVHRNLIDVPVVKTTGKGSLLSNVSEISNDFRPEGRVWSTFPSGENNVINLTSILGQIYSVHHSYNAIVPTYIYDIIKERSVSDDLERTKKRYKIFSVLNVRFQMHPKQSTEFMDCSKVFSQSDSCTFIKSRLSPLVENNDGGIYYDSGVLPKAALISNGILVIGDNRFNDFSAFIAKKIIFHPDLDIKNMTILSSKKDLEDYSIDELKNFPAIILVNPKIKDKNKYEDLKQEYKKNGKLIELNSKWIHYESLHERSGSIWTESSAWDYSDNDSKTLSELFRNFSSQNNQQGTVKIQKFTPEDLIFEVDTKEENVVLQFSDSYYPGWKAELNDRKTHVYMADGLVKGVVIPEKGRHKIRIYYSPVSFKIGTGITTFTIGILSILGFYTARRSLKKKSIKLTDIISGISSFLKKSQKDFMNLLQSQIKESRNLKYLTAFLVLLFLFILFSPIFLNSIASFGDLPYYWDTYLRSLSLPQIWNPHWPTGLGGNQTIILPLKFYIQIFIPPLISNLGISWEIYHKIFFACVFIVLSVWTSFLLTRSWIGSLIYSTNTWILMVLSGGQMGVALSYAIIPLVLIAFQSIIKQFNLRTSLFFSLIFSIQLMFDQRMALITLGIILILLAFKALKNPPSISHLQKKLFLLLIIPAAIFALNLYWILPLLFSRIIGASALSVITGESGQANFFSFAFFENSISLLHPNYPENIFGKVSFMKPEFIILPIIAFSGLLFSKAERFNKVLIYSLIGLIGAFLAKGTNEPFDAVYTWLFQNVPGFSLFRDPTKFYVLIALAYTILTPFVLNEISNGVLSFAKRFSKKSLSIVLIHFLLSLAFIAFWGFTIRDSFLGNAGGIFKETRVPQEYTQLKDYLELQSDFSRTLWIPTRQRFGYFSDNHPAMDGYDLFGRMSAASMAAKLENADVQRLLANLSIKYIVVPFDNRGEIFLTDRKYDESLWQATIERLDNNRSINKDVKFGKLSLYGTRVYNGRFYIQQSDGRAIPNLPYQKIDSTKYIVPIKDAGAGDTLVFSEGYDLGWQATSEDLKIFPIPRERLINGFVLPRDGDYSFEVYYRPQSVLGVGFVVSGVVLLLTISTIVYLRSKEIKK